LTLPDDDKIDLSDIPEAGPEWFARATRKDPRMLNIDVNHWHRVYRACDDAAPDTEASKIAQRINRAASAVMDSFTAYDYCADASDKAERMVASITAYFFESNPSFLAAVPGTQSE
jgi:hypothetical protein